MLALNGAERSVPGAVSVFYVSSVFFSGTSYAASPAVLAIFSSASFIAGPSGDVCCVLFFRLQCQKRIALCGRGGRGGKEKTRH